jgi:hypothetical protein
MAKLKPDCVVIRLRSVCVTRSGYSFLILKWFPTPDKCTASSARGAPRSIYTCELTTLGKRGFSDYAMLVSFPRDIGQLLRGSTVASVSYISTYSG